MTWSKRPQKDTTVKKEVLGNKTKTPETKANKTPTTTTQTVDTYKNMYAAFISGQRASVCGLWHLDMQRRTQQLERRLSDALKKKHIQGGEAEVGDGKKEETAQGAVSSHCTAHVESAVHEFPKKSKSSSS